MEQAIHKMPCHITDGPDYDDESQPEPDEDDEFERVRSQELNEALIDTATTVVK